MQTDTEVLAYALDLLARKQKLPIEVVTSILAPPLWVDIDCMKSKEGQICTVIRQCYNSLLMNGPFTIIAAHNGEMIGLTDRIKLRPLTAATMGDLLYLSSEESAIQLVSSNLDKVWSPRGGEPVIGRLKAPKPLESYTAEVVM
jgi:glutamate synthase domain-containing protein 1